MIKAVNLHEADWRSASNGETFQRSVVALTGANNSSGLGCSAYRVQPGKRAFPRHGHLANDEALFVLSGSGKLKVGEETLQLRAGDFVSLPRGAEYAHELRNDGSEDLEYLCISTMNIPDVIHYPDSDKLGILERNSWSGPEGMGRVGGMYRRNKAGYWDDEN